MKNVIIDGVEYTPIDSGTDYVIVRGDRSGVFFGQIGSKKGTEIVLNNCRRLWYWEGAASISEIAIKGVSKSDRCKFPIATQHHTITDAIEIIPCTEDAVKSIQGVKIWTSNK